MPVYAGTLRIGVLPLGLVVLSVLHRPGSGCALGHENEELEGHKGDPNHARFLGSQGPENTSNANAKQILFWRNATEYFTLILSLVCAVLPRQGTS